MIIFWLILIQTTPVPLISYAHVQSAVLSPNHLIFKFIISIFCICIANYYLITLSIIIINFDLLYNPCMGSFY